MTYLGNWRCFHGTGTESSECHGCGRGGVGGKKARGKVGMKGPRHQALESKFILYAIGSY